MKFELNWPGGFREDVDGRTTDWRPDTGVTGILYIFGSGELTRGS